jgi:hypothetical protein
MSIFVSVLPNMNGFTNAQIDEGSAFAGQEVCAVCFKIVPTLSVRENKSRMIKVQLFDVLVTVN